MNSPIRFITLIFTAALAAALAVGAFADEARLRILVPQSIASIPFFEIEQRDESTDVVPGVSVSVEMFANHAQALARLLNGDVDLLFTGSSVGWANHLGGGPLEMIGTGVWGVSSVIGNRDDYREIEDLRGKKLVLPFPGAPLDLQMRYILEKSGIDPDTDLQIIYAPFPQAAAQLLTGKVDAAPLPEPLATSLVIGKGLKRYVRVQDAWAAVSGGDTFSPQVSLLGNGETIGAGYKFLAMLLEAWQDASLYVAENPEDAAAAYAETLNTPVPIIEEAIRNTIFYVPGTHENRTRVLEYLETVERGDGSLPRAEFFFE